MSFTSYATTAALRAVSGSSSLDIAVTAGYAAAGDGGGGQWYWDSADSTTNDNTGTVLAPVPGSAGRWKRIGPGITGNTAATTLDVRWFGAIPDAATDVAPFVLNAFKALPANKPGTLFFHAGIYVFTTSIIFPTGYATSVQLLGQGAAAGGGGTVFDYNQSSGSMFQFNVAAGLQDIAFVNINSATSVAHDLLFFNTAVP